nr:uncharacterized protein LOC108124828 [Drosophila bipectinata]
MLPLPLLMLVIDPVAGVACEEKDPLALKANSKLMSRQPAADSEYRRRSLSHRRRRCWLAAPSHHPLPLRAPKKKPAHRPTAAEEGDLKQKEAGRGGGGGERWRRKRWEAEEEEKSAVQREHRIESDPIGSVVVVETRRPEGISKISGTRRSFAAAEAEAETVAAVGVGGRRKYEFGQHKRTNCDTL